MNICYICNTPYQLFNSLNHYYHNNKGETDLYIGKIFYKYEKISELLYKESIFSNIYMYDCPKYSNIIDKFLQTFVEVYAIDKSVRKWTHQEEILNVAYDVIYMSVYTPFSIALKQINPNAQIILFDDGIGTYTGNAQKMDFKKRRLIYRILGKKFPDLDYDILYVNSIEFYNLTNQIKKEEVCSLPGINKGETDFLSLLNRVFRLGSEEIYDQRHLIFLTQPNDRSKTRYKVIEKSILERLQTAKESLLLRVHPREFEYDFGDFEQDKNRSLWELVVLNHITDEHILVSVFSTAQFIPKVMYGMEPTLIFTYKLYQDIYTSKEIAEMEYTVSKLADLYTDKAKIIIPQNFESFSNALLKLGY